MSLEIRPVEPDEWATFIRVTDFAFGKLRSDEDVVWMVESLPDFTCRGAFDGSRMVATSLDYVCQLTLPGGLDTPVVAITWVGTLPTDRRRGAMRGLMDATLEDARAAGVDRAALWVSEYPLYSRFGFGPATAAWVEITVDTVHGGFAQPFHDPGACACWTPPRLAGCCRRPTSAAGWVSPARWTEFPTTGGTP